jgi:DNA-binding NarL/FixJ family response regulator
MTDSTRGCVLLADRHHGLTEGVRGLLETTFASVFVVNDEASLLKGTERLTPRLVIVDIALASGDLAGLVSRLIARSPHSKVLMLSVHDEPCVAQAAVRAGAHAVVLKRSIVTDLLPAIDALLDS